MSRVEQNGQGAPTQFGMKLEFTVLVAVHVVVLLLTIYSFVQPAPAQAHPGRTAADGCHNDRKNGGRHCHGGSTGPQASAPRRTPAGDVYYPNCAAARAAGAAPVRRGDPGYAGHLDRDSDGIGCE